MIRVIGYIDITCSVQARLFIVTYFITKILSRQPRPRTFYLSSIMPFADGVNGPGRGNEKYKANGFLNEITKTAPKLPEYCALSYLNKSSQRLWTVVIILLLSAMYINNSVGKHRK